MNRRLAKIGSSEKHRFLCRSIPVFLFVCLGCVQVFTQNDLTRMQELFNEGNSFLNKGDHQKAVQKYDEAIAVSPTAPAVYLNRGLAYIYLSRFTNAHADVDKALALLNAVGNDQRQSAVGYQIRGLAFQSQGDLKSAIEAYSKAIELGPSRAAYWNGRGNSYQLSQRRKEAIADYTEAIKLDPRLPHSYINRSSIYRDQKKFNDALRDLDEALKIDKTIPALFLHRGNVYLDTGKFDEALNDYNNAISLQPKPEYFYARGRLHTMRGNYDLGVNDNTEALRRDPSNAEAYRNRAVAYSYLGKLDLALADLRNAVALKPNSVPLRFNLAIVLFRTGQISAAIDEATKVINITPEWQAPFLLRSAAYSKLGNVQKARLDRAQASKLNPKFVPDGEPVIAFSLDIIETENIEQ